MATIQGVWLFNDTVTIDISSQTVNVNFVSNGTAFSRIVIIKNTLSNGVSYMLYDNLYMYNTSAKWGTGTAYKTVDFGATAQTIPDAFYQWLTANAVQQGVEQPDQPDQDTSSGTIIYNGKTIATLTEGQTVTISCNGNVMLGDIVIVNNSSTGASLITFTVDGMTCQAEDGMTWAEWCESEYNTIGLTINGLDVVFAGGVLYYLYADTDGDGTFEKVVRADKIQRGGEYEGRK